MSWSNDDEDPSSSLYSCGLGVFESSAPPKFIALMVEMDNTMLLQFTVEESN